MRTLRNIILVLLAALPLYGQGNFDDDLVTAADLRRAGEFKAAERAYTALLAQQPENADVLIGLGFCRLGLGRVKEAAADFSRAAGIAPDYVDAYLGLAAVLKRQGKRTQARAQLEKCRRSVGSDTAKLQYLATGAWQQGFVSLARELDRQYGPAGGRVLLERPRRITLELAYSALDGGDFWFSGGAVYLQRLRPDLGFTLRGAGHRRPASSDVEAGAGIFYRISDGLTVSYDALFSDVPGFTPIHRHLPRLTYTFPSGGTTAGLGADIALYDAGLLALGTLLLRQPLGPVAMRYLLKAGVDPLEETVVSHLADISWGGTERLLISFGGACGNESVELTGPSYTSQEVATVFAGIGYPVSRDLRVALTAAGEWRDSDYFRTVITLAPALSF